MPFRLLLLLIFSPFSFLSLSHCLLSLPPLLSSRHFFHYCFIYYYFTITLFIIIFITPLCHYAIIIAFIFAIISLHYYCHAAFELTLRHFLHITPHYFAITPYAIIFRWDIDAAPDYLYERHAYYYAILLCRFMMIIDALLLPHIIIYYCHYFFLWYTLLRRSRHYAIYAYYWCHHYAFIAFFWYYAADTISFSYCYALSFFFDIAVTPWILLRHAIIMLAIFHYFIISTSPLLLRHYYAITPLLIMNCHYATLLFIDAGFSLSLRLLIFFIRFMLLSMLSTYFHYWWLHSHFYADAYCHYLFYYAIITLPLLLLLFHITPLLPCHYAFSPLVTLISQMLLSLLSFSMIELSFSMPFITAILFSFADKIIATIITTLRFSLLITTFIDISTLLDTHNNNWQ